MILSDWYVVLLHNFYTMKHQIYTNCKGDFLLLSTIIFHVITSFRGKVTGFITARAPSASVNECVILFASLRPLKTCISNGSTCVQEFVALKFEPTDLLQHSCC